MKALNPSKATVTTKINTDKVANHWDTNGKKPPKQWLHSLYVRQKVLLHPLEWHGGCWFNWLQRTYFKIPAKNALSLCCGSGQYERRLIQVGAVKKITGIDISEGQLERARKKAENSGYQEIISYQQANIQEANLPKNEYDFIMVVAGLHHLTNLPHVFQQIHKALKLNGVLVITEYIGPDHMDYPQWERELFQRVLLTISPEKRIRASTGKLHERAGQQTREQAIDRDPSEGVNSSLIMENLKEYFKTEREIEMGNSMLRECLYDIVDNFSDENKNDNEIIDNLVDLERTLRENKLIENHHVFGVYKPK